MPPDRGALGRQGRYRSQCGSTSRVQEVAGKVLATCLGIARRVKGIGAAELEGYGKP